MDAIRVMLADDHDILRQGLCALLQMEENIQVVGEASSGETLLRKIEHGVAPDVVLMDVSMHGMSGIEATKQLKQRHPSIQVIGLTALDSADTIRGMLQAGACGYVFKSMAVDQVVKAIRAAYHHKAWLPSEIQLRLQQKTEPKPAPQTMHCTLKSAAKPAPELTQREHDVIQILLRGYSNKEIARQLVISERTVQTHLSNIFSKLDVTSRTEAVLIAVQEGWLSQ